MIKIKNFLVTLWKKSMNNLYFKKGLWYTCRDIWLNNWKSRNKMWHFQTRRGKKNNINKENSDNQTKTGRRIKRWQRNTNRKH